VSPRLVGPRPWLGGWLLLILFLQAACATGVPRGSPLGGHRSKSLASPPAPTERAALGEEPGLESASVYSLDFLEPGAVATARCPSPQPNSSMPSSGSPATCG